MIVIGETGEQIGTVDRIEIDRWGRLKSVILVCSTGLRRRHRIAAHQVRSLRGNELRVAISTHALSQLDAADAPSPARHSSGVPVVS